MPKDELLNLGEVMVLLLGAIHFMINLRSLREGQNLMVEVINTRSRMTTGGARSTSIARGVEMEVEGAREARIIRVHMAIDRVKVREEEIGMRPRRRHHRRRAAAAVVGKGRRKKFLLHLQNESK